MEFVPLSLLLLLSVKRCFESMGRSKRRSDGRGTACVLGSLPLPPSPLASPSSPPQPSPHRIVSSHRQKRLCRHPARSSARIAALAMSSRSHPSPAFSHSPFASPPPSKPKKPHSSSSSSPPSTKAKTSHPSSPPSFSSSRAPPSSYPSSRPPAVSTQPPNTVAPSLFASHQVPSRTVSSPAHQSSPQLQQLALPQHPSSQRAPAFDTSGSPYEPLFTSSAYSSHRLSHATSSGRSSMSFTHPITGSVLCVCGFVERSPMCPQRPSTTDIRYLSAVFD